MLSVSGGTRPSQHWDGVLTETLSLGDVEQRWVLHLGQSFEDVPTTSVFYRFVETILHRGVTSGCSGTRFCPGTPVTREQLAALVLAAREGAGYRPPQCQAPLFYDVPVTSPFCPWIYELVRRGVVAGCTPSAYCPGAAVTREQIAVFVLRTLDPAMNPPACTMPVFSDVPATSPFCRWIEELARRGIAAGCGSGNYCPGAPVTREQAAVFLSASFGLTLYGP